MSALNCNVYSHKTGQTLYSFLMPAAAMFRCREKKHINVMLIWHITVILMVSVIATPTMLQVIRQVAGESCASSLSQPDLA